MITWVYIDYLTTLKLSFLITFLIVCYFLPSVDPLKPIKMKRKQ